MGRHGENIRKRKDGRWEARMLLGYDENNKARYHSVYGRTYSEVKEKRLEWIKKTDFSKPTARTPINIHKLTLEQLTSEWLRSKHKTVKESTYAHYTRIVRNHINPKLGDYFISAITANIINDFLRQKLYTGNLETGGPLSPKTVADIRSVILQNIAYAKQLKYPFCIEERLFYPHAPRSQIKVFSLDEQNRFEKLLYYNMNHFKLGILVSLYSGLRIGEICALQWKDIHFEDGTLHISKTILRIQNTESVSNNKTKVVITTPKTNTSHRIIPLPSFILKILKENCQPPDYYVLSGNQHPIEPRSCLERYKRLLRIAGLDHYTFHALRHTFATRCVESNFDIKSLSEILGHSNITTTLQRYVHPSMDLKRAQMERLETLTIYK